MTRTEFRTLFRGVAASARTALAGFEAMPVPGPENAGGGWLVVFLTKSGNPIAMRYDAHGRLLAGYEVERDATDPGNSARHLGFFVAEEWIHDQSEGRTD